MHQDKCVIVDTEECRSLARLTVGLESTLRYFPKPLRLGVYNYCSLAIFLKLNVEIQMIEHIIFS